MIGKLSNKPRSKCISQSVAFSDYQWSSLTVYHYCVLVHMSHDLFDFGSEKSDVELVTFYRGVFAIFP